jgi:dihydrofolate reductase
MSKLKVHCFAMSLDGFSAGPDQNLDNPLGVGGVALMEWFFATRTWRRMHDLVDAEDGEDGVDERMAARSFENIGAWILGRNMFGPVRGPWPDDSWRGWWGEEPPYHVPAFVLTHHARPPLAMQGGTTFHFVTGGIEEALRRATEAAGGKDVRLGGGAATVRQYLQARRIDEMHLALRPVLIGRGENLLAGLDLPGLGYEVGEVIPGERATHVIIRKAGVSR